MKKLMVLLSIIILTAALAVGCSSNKASEETKTLEKADKLMVVDTDKKEIRMETEVNAKYFTESTRHGVVFKDGSNGEKSALRGLVSQFDFHQALLDIGAKPGDNLKMEDMKKSVAVAGDKIDVFVTWEGLGKEIPFNDIIKSSDAKPMDIRFGGNLESAKATNTGCVLCLDSCAVGITSNANYVTGSSDTVKFYGNEEILPEDGTRVTVVFKLAQ
ncbi:MAG: YdjY domain-containing protein [Clostridium sp.]